jgi:hypothetical protein
VTLRQYMACFVLLLCAVLPTDRALARDAVVNDRPSEQINVRAYAACDGLSDDWPGLQLALTRAVSTGKTLDFGSSTCNSSRQLSASNGNVSIVAHQNAGGVRFTNPASAGLAFSLRGYRNGAVDRISIKGLTIIAGSVHADPALKIAWQSRVANGERMLSLDGVTVRPESFGTYSFARDLWIDSAFNGSIVDFFALGNATASGTSIYVNQSISIIFARPNVNWRGVAAHFTTGDKDEPQPQSEGIYLDHPVFYNVNKCVLIDGKSTMSLNMIDFSWNSGHCAANQGRAPRALDLNLVAQSHVAGATIYAYLQPNDVLADLRSVSESDFMGNFLLGMIGRSTGTGMRFAATSIGNRVVANRFSNFAKGLEFSSENDSANWFSANQFNACAEPIVDRGLANSDGGNSVALSSTVIKRNTQSPR